MKIIRFLFILTIFHTVYSGLKAQSELDLVESTGGCGLLTDCDANILCLDIILTPALTAEVISYNLWIQYDGVNISYLSDSACITQDGNDNDQFEMFGFYRVAGVSGTQQVMVGEPVTLHTVCFTFENAGDLAGQTVSAGGTVFGLNSTLTYNNPIANEDPVPEFPFLMDESSISCLEPFAVNLLSFNAYRNGDMASLEWVATQEFNHAGYDIERSVSGIDFEKIGFIEAKGDKESTVSYHFDDLHPKTGTNYYRLKQIDKDGTFQFSEIRVVAFSEGPAVMHAFPNPVSTELNVIIVSDQETDFELELVTMSGQVAASGWNFPANHPATADISAVAPGVYYLIAKSDQQTLMKKIVVLK